MRGAGLRIEKQLAGHLIGSLALASHTIVSRLIR